MKCTIPLSPVSGELGKEGEEGEMIVAEVAHDTATHPYTTCFER